MEQKNPTSKDQLDGAFFLRDPCQTFMAYKVKSLISCRTIIWMCEY